MVLGMRLRVRRFWVESIKLGDGVRRIYRAIGMGCLATVSLGIALDMDYNKSHFITNPKELADAQDAKPHPATLIGAIYRTLVSDLFAKEYEKLPSKQPKQPRLELVQHVREEGEESEDDDEEIVVPAQNSRKRGRNNNEASGSGAGGSGGGDHGDGDGNSRRKRKQTSILGINDGSDAFTATPKKSAKERTAAKKNTKASVKKLKTLVEAHEIGKVTAEDTMVKVAELVAALEKSTADL